ncbi:MAG: hypothetical protein D6721_09785 [Gammaproteobacteria bacterium]|nr:MAG: hypothetical protein D6721_09785 [Gammaproteobacteria bacterium]
MDLERARELLRMHTEMGSGYNRNAARLILAEVQRVHGPAAVDRLIVELDLEHHFGFRPGQRFHAP